MAKEFNRTQRVAQEIQKEVAVILQRDFKDPRVGFVTVSGVDVSRDLAHAKVFITFLNFEQSDVLSEKLAILNESRKYIRMLLSKVMRLRIIPDITFAYDHSLVEGMRITNLVNQAVNQDVERRNQADLGENDQHSQGHNKEQD